MRKIFNFPRKGSTIFHKRRIFFFALSPILIELSFYVFLHNIFSHSFFKYVFWSFDCLFAFLYDLNKEKILNLMRNVIFHMKIRVSFFFLFFPILFFTISLFEFLVTFYLEHFFFFFQFHTCFSCFSNWTFSQYVISFLPFQFSVSSVRDDRKPFKSWMVW